MRLISGEEMERVCCLQKHCSPFTGHLDNFVFSKIASDQCEREQNLAWASARVICVSLVMGPETSLADRY